MAVAGAGVALALPAAAQDVCIVCQDPNVTYRCASQDASVRAGDVRLAFSCITELAKSGGHSSCSVSRKQTGACEGVPKTVGVIGPDTPAVIGRPAAPTAPDPAAPASPPATAEQKSKKKDGPPDTVAELAKRTAESSKEQLKKAGEGVTGAAKKSWRCLTSFFKDC